MIELVGTSHVAGGDLADIRRRVAESEAGVVALELDPGRLDALLHQQDRRPRNPFILLLKTVQDLLGRHTGIMPGSDMLAAVNAAEDAGKDIALIDREIAVTLQRLRRIPLREKVKFAGMLLLSPFLFSRRDVDLEHVPSAELVGELLLRFRVSFPRMYEVLVEERNSVMAERLAALEEEYGAVVAVVGAGHVSGIRERLAAA